MTASLLDRHVDAVLRRRWPVVALATLLMLAVTAGARFIGVTNDYRSMFAADNPQLAALDALEDTYSASNLALIAVAPREGSVFTREVLGAVEALTPMVALLVVASGGSYARLAARSASAVTIRRLRALAVARRQERVRAAKTRIKGGVGMTP